MNVLDDIIIDHFRTHWHNDIGVYIRKPYFRISKNAQTTSLPRRNAKPFN